MLRSETALQQRRARLILVVSIVAMAWVQVGATQRWEQDSAVVYQGTRELVRWARAGFDGPLRPIGPFAPFQYLTGLPATAASAALGLPVPTMGFWRLCGTVSFAGVACLAYRAAGGATGADGDRRSACAAALVILVGPLLAYSNSTFNELPAAFVMAAFACAAIGGGGTIACAALFVASGLTKETAWPLLVPIWLAGTWARRDSLGRRGVRRHAIALVVAVALTVAANAGFNALRYGVVWNVEYAAPAFIVRHPPWQAERAAALWLAPNGGVFAFWPAWVIATAAIAAIVWRRRREVSLVPLFASAAVLTMLTVGLSAWYAPFGWWCWGPRLMLPTLTAVFVLLVRAYRREWQAFAVGLLATRKRATMVAIVAAALAVPHACQVLDDGPGEAVASFFRDDEGRFPDFAGPADQAAEHERLSYLAWRKSPPLLIRPLRLLGRFETAVPAIAHAAAVAALTLLAAGGAVGPISAAPAVQSTNS